jgi:hypothetical protein
MAAVAALVVAFEGGSGSPLSTGTGFSDQSGATTHAGSADEDRRVPDSRSELEYRVIRHVKRSSWDDFAAPATRTALRVYRDVLADDLDPGGTRLSALTNVQSGGGVLGTKLDWNGGGMLELTVGGHWGSASSVYALEDAGMTPTTYDGHPARVSTRGDDIVVSVQHTDGTIVTLIASTTFGNNGTSIESTGLVRHQLLDAASDPRLHLPKHPR